jgi:hypothetical protein
MAVLQAPILLPYWNFRSREIREKWMQDLKQLGERVEIEGERKEELWGIAWHGELVWAGSLSKERLAILNQGEEGQEEMEEKGD